VRLASACQLAADNALTGLPGGRSNWHTVDADEIWLWHAGSPLEISTADASGKEQPRQVVMLGPDVLADEQPQVLIAKDDWQMAYARTGWALVSPRATVKGVRKTR
jgi:predicted cupin superfamily sugar epimerase